MLFSTILPIWKLQKNNNHTIKKQKQKNTFFVFSPLKSLPLTPVSGVCVSRSASPRGKKKHGIHWSSGHCLSERAELAASLTKTYPPVN